jgi:epoxyqueuosine reductase
MMDALRDDPGALASFIRAAATEMGLSGIGFARPEVGAAAMRLRTWLATGRHGEMAWMARHESARADPQALRPGTRSVICARLDYWPRATPPKAVLDDAGAAYVSRYALGRDYHRLLRVRLERLARAIAARIGPFGYRAFADSAPVLEKPLAARAGLGWAGKHTGLLTPQGSWFFLGELYTDLDLPEDGASPDRCGACEACIRACPTGAITAPYQLDARRCISYLTIEHSGPIPEPLRPALGNRIYGCDDCQLVCPWNRHAQYARDDAFDPRHGLDCARLVELMDWSAQDFDTRLQGSPIRRIGHERWQRNLAVALGNAPPGDRAAIACLGRHAASPSALVREHVAWALARHAAASAPGTVTPAAGARGNA